MTRRRPVSSARKPRRTPSPALLIALIALVFSTTGLADAARHAVVSAVAGHPISTKPHAGGILLLGKNASSPPRRSRPCKNASRVGGKTAAELAGTCPPATVDLGTWCLETRSFPAHEPDRSARTTTSGPARRAWPKAAGCRRPRNCSAPPTVCKLESTIHDSPAHGHDQPRSQPRAERPARDELHAGHHRSRLGCRRL